MVYKSFKLLIFVNLFFGQMLLRTDTWCLKRLILDHGIEVARVSLINNDTHTVIDITLTPLTLFKHDLITHFGLNGGKNLIIMSCKTESQNLFETYVWNRMSLQLIAKLNQGNVSDALIVKYNQEYRLMSSHEEFKDKAFIWQIQPLRSREDYACFDTFYFIEPAT